MANYYYIISSLPVLKMESRLSEEVLDEAWFLIQNNCSAEDWQQINWFVKRNDLHNLLESWQHRYLAYPFRPLRKPYSIGSDKIAASEKDPQLLDAIWLAFYEEHSDDFNHWTANEMDSNWFSYFFQMVSLKGHSFISALFQFEDEVRSLMATFNTSLYSFVNKDYRYGVNPIHQQLLLGKSQLSEKQKLEYPFLELLLNSLSSKDPEIITNAVHQVLWNKADDLARGHYFDQVSLLNYCFKLFLIYRREQLKINQNKPFLADLLAESIKNIKYHD